MPETPTYIKRWSSKAHRTKDGRKHPWSGVRTGWLSPEAAAHTNKLNKIIYDLKATMRETR